MKEHGIAMNVLKMINWIKTQNTYYRITIYSLFLVLFISLTCIPIFILLNGEVPLGLIIGCSYGALMYFILGYLDKFDTAGKKPVAILILTAVRFIGIGIILLVCAMAYYKFDNHSVNVFALVGGYMIPLTILIIISIRNRKEA